MRKTLNNSTTIGWILAMNNFTCPRKQANAQKALELFIDCCKSSGVKRILDVGAGEIPYHANDIKTHGLNVETNDFFPSSDHKGEYLLLPPFEKQFDAIWCAHALEHQRNIGMVLDRMYNDVKEGGIICITVPPAKDTIVGGHVTLWNAGLLLYNMILAKFDCSNAAVATYGYNISVLVKKKTAHLPQLTYDSPDIELLKRFFPAQLSIRKSFNGQITSINWNKK